MAAVIVQIVTHCFSDNERTLSVSVLLCYSVNWKMRIWIPEIFHIICAFSSIEQF